MKVMDGSLIRLPIPVDFFYYALLIFPPNDISTFFILYLISHIIKGQKNTRLRRPTGQQDGHL